LDYLISEKAHQSPDKTTGIAILGLDKSMAKPQQSRTKAMVKAHRLY